MSDEIFVGNRTVYISADECAVKVSLKTSNKGYVEAIDYICAFLENKSFPPEVQNLSATFKDQVEKRLPERDNILRSMISHFFRKHS